jgi:hypothetical protein
MGVWIVDIVFLIACGGHDEGRLWIMEMAEDAMLRAIFVFAAYHINVISDMTRWMRLAPVLLRLMPQLIA